MTSTTAGRAGVVLGGGLMAVSGFATWRNEGAGSTMSGLELASVLRRSQLAPRGAGLLALGLIVVPVVGAIAMAAAGFGGRPLIGSALLAGLTVVVLAAIALGGLLPVADWASGPYLAVAGGVLVAAATGAIVLRSAT